MAKTLYDFWVKSDRLWHAMKKGTRVALCGHECPKPRVMMKLTIPLDDVRCARCDRLIMWDGNPDRPKPTSA
jgi:hypothetical protein